MRFIFVTRHPLVTLLLIVAAVLVIPLSCTLASEPRDGAPVMTTVPPTCAMFCEGGR